jgi:hypothetical protein
MVVEARLVIIDHRAAWGFPALREYLLKEAVSCKRGCSKPAHNLL